MKTEEILKLTKDQDKWAFLTGTSQWENWLYGEAWIAVSGQLKRVTWKGGLEKKDPKVKDVKATPDILAEIDMIRGAEERAAVSMLANSR